MYCEHLTKVASKFMPVQESVSDPSDIIHSLKKMPVVHLMDDPCTFVR